MGPELAVAFTFQIPLVTLPAGSQTFGPVTVPDTDVSVTFSIDRSVAGGLNSLTADSTLFLQAEMSTDSGATWHAVDSSAGADTHWSTTGGVFTGKNGIAAVSSGTWMLAAGSSRRLRATVTVSGPSSIAVAGSIATQ